MAETLNDLKYRVLGEQGYRGTLNDREYQFYANGAGGSSEPVTWESIEGKPSTYPPTIGTTATTAKAGNYQPTWAQVTGKPAVIAAGTDAAAARAAIGAGTSDLAIGTTATTAKAGNYQPTWTQVTSKPTLMTQATAAPASPTSTGTPGQYFITPDALYICVATDTWRQSTLTEWTP